MNQYELYNILKKLEGSKFTARQIAQMTGQGIPCTITKLRKLCRSFEEIKSEYRCSRDGCLYYYIKLKGDDKDGNQ